MQHSGLGFRLNRTRTLPNTNSPDNYMLRLRGDVICFPRKLFLSTALFFEFPGQFLTASFFDELEVPARSG